MQARLNAGTGTLNVPPVVLPLAERSPLQKPFVTRSRPMEPMSALRQSRRDVLRQFRSEQLAWLGLALGSLAVVAASFLR